MVFEHQCSRERIKRVPGRAGVRRPVQVLLALCVAAVSSLSGQSAPACPAPASLTDGLDPPFAHVRYLADDALEGRASGSAGERCAAEYIASVFAAAGLEGAADGGSFFQSFPIRGGAALGTHNLLRGGGRERGRAGHRVATVRLLGDRACGRRVRLRRPRHQPAGQRGRGLRGAGAGRPRRGGGGRRPALARGHVAREPGALQGLRGGARGGRPVWSCCSPTEATCRNSPTRPVRVRPFRSRRCGGRPARLCAPPPGQAAISS